MIRRMEEGDLQQVCDIESRCFSVPWTYDIFRDSIFRKEYVYLVFITEKQIVGYCGLLDIGGEGDIVNVAVHPAYRNRQIGRELLEALLQEGIKRGISAFTLEVRVSNGAAIHIYEEAGFVPAGVRPGYYEKPREDALIMWKRPAG